MAMKDYRSKRKQDNIEPADVRTIAIKVLVNQSELAQIEAAQSGTGLSRAEIIRALIAGKKIERVPIVPPINIDTARDLGRSLGNLATLAVAMRAGNFIELEDIRCRVVELQQSLRGQK